MRGQTFESNGPDGKIRGSAQQVYDKYLALGRDATTAGDRIAAEGFYQHAEHYHRLINAEESQAAARNRRAQSGPESDGVASAPVQEAPAAQPPIGEIEPFNF